MKRECNFTVQTVLLSACQPRNHVFVFLERPNAIIDLHLGRGAEQRSERVNWGSDLVHSRTSPDDIAKLYT
jgi:hypothetical protein